MTSIKQAIEALEIFNDSQCVHGVDCETRKSDKVFHFTDDEIQIISRALSAPVDAVVCDGCGRVGAEPPPPPALSCCPERRLVPVQQYIRELQEQAWKAPAPPPDMVCVRVEDLPNGVIQAGLDAYDEDQYRAPSQRLRAMYKAYRAMIAASQEREG